MYSCLLQQLRGHVPGRVNSTREVTLGFSGDIGAALHFTQSRDYASCQSGNACQKRATVLHKKQRFKVVLYKKMRVLCKKSDFWKVQNGDLWTFFYHILSPVFPFGTAIFRESDKFLTSPLIFFPSNALTTVVYRYWKKVKEWTISPRDSLLISNMKPSIS